MGLRVDVVARLKYLDYHPKSELDPDLECNIKIALDNHHSGRGRESGNKIGHGGNLFRFKVSIYTQNVPVSRPVKWVIKSTGYIMISNV